MLSLLRKEPRQIRISEIASSHLPWVPLPFLTTQALSGTVHASTVLRYGQWTRNASLKIQKIRP